jgi:RHH-type rel operon transcriptional repressor/antitoxin RelB
MTLLSLRLPEDLYVRLDQLAKTTDRNKSYIIRRAIEEFLEEEEDYVVALSRLSANETHYGLQEVEKFLGLDRSH